MYDLNLENTFYRVFAISTDKYGIDPLLDKVIPRLLSITSYTNHEVKQDERGAADLISFREYGKEDFWWHIMAYNGICRFRDIVEGMTLKIPDIGGVVQITHDATSERSSPGNDTISI